MKVKVITSSESSATFERDVQTFLDANPGIVIQSTNYSMNTVMGSNRTYSVMIVYSLPKIEA
jgi:hypothetical protein